MQISPTDQLDADIDYFAADATGHILHVASGGGVLPESVAADQEGLLALHQYFLTLPEPAAGGALAAAEAVETSYPGATRYARRGLFSFAKTDLHAPSDPRYHLVARPLRPLTVAELPPELAALLRRTLLPGSVVHQSTLDVSSIP
ncbi:hypothetical protein SAMN02745146_1139 [Hymenobacter daecheongensis DSM 21074]|uniref:Uncharacterized protein n=1 Tax=Hymenobacter daecheongensis DSM 21074 TaxID=1121955 RepID=A0A1M6CGK3_9BACT|nr:hypothetical protein [Hymenobacter daecheongensis]SHI59818.1 hypothetical protein SAMN02745146_1139 [Hymenobacter daecheongensis DSM 21074]